MNDHFSIREAGALDLPSVLQLLAQPAMDDGKVLSLQQAQEVFAEMRRVPNYRLYVAAQGSKIVGMFALLVMPNLGHMGASSGVLEDVVVAHGLHGEGIGRRMVRYALELCRDQGCYKMALSSNLSRRDAHGFYEHLGFEQHGVSYLMRL